jgi:hypothetical protein
LAKAAAAKFAQYRMNAASFFYGRSASICR